MADTNSDYHVVGAAGAVTYADRGNDRPVQLPRDLPGIVIFLHGVNDPGAVYSFVEEGLCKGLNDRLSRNDMNAGSYGAQYSKLKAKKIPASRTMMFYLTLILFFISARKFLAQPRVASSRFIGVIAHKAMKLRGSTPRGKATPKR